MRSKKILVDKNCITTAMYDIPPESLQIDMFKGDNGTYRVTDSYYNKLFTLYKAVILLYKDVILQGSCTKGVEVQNEEHRNSWSMVVLSDNMIAIKNEIESLRVAKKNINTVVIDAPIGEDTIIANVVDE
jgi:hypothetical protein